MLREIVEKIELNEASTMVALGVNQKQIKAIYGLIKRSYPQSTVDAKAQFIAYKGKKEVTDLMRSENFRRAIIVGISKNGDVYIVIQKVGEKSFFIIQFDAQGKKVDSWQETSAIKALSHFKGVKEYQLAKDGGTITKSSDQFYSDKEDINKFGSKIFDIIEKDLKNVFVDNKKILGKKISDSALSGDFVKVSKYVDRITRTNGGFGDETIERSFEDFINNDAWWDREGIRSLVIRKIADNTGKYIPNYGKIPVMDNILNNSSKIEIRKASIEVLKDFKEEFKNIIRDIV